jgi:hypothetical protein
MRTLCLYSTTRPEKNLELTANKGKEERNERKWAKVTGCSKRSEMSHRSEMACWKWVGNDSPKEEHDDRTMTAR